MSLTVNLLGGTLYAYGGRGISQRNFQATKDIPSNSLQPKNFSSCYTQKPAHEHEISRNNENRGLANPEISVQQYFMSKNIMNIFSVLYGPKNITFGNILTQKYRTFLLVCGCAECPPWGYLWLMHYLDIK